jgi:hypothetical protein
LFPTVLPIITRNFALLSQHCYFLNVTSLSLYDNDRHFFRLSGMLKP